MNMKFKIGMRTIKTALAVSISVLLSQVMHLEYPFYAAIASIVVMQAYTKDTVKAGKNRMLGTLAGALMGALFAIIPFSKVILCGIGITILFCLCNLFKWEKSVSIAGIVFMRIMVDLENESPLKFGANRLLDTLIGVLVAILVNFIFFPYHHSDKIETYYNEFEDKIAHIMQNLIVFNQNVNIEELKKDLASLNKRLNNNINEFKIKNTKNNELMKIKDNLAAYEEVITHLHIIQKIKGETCLNNENKEKLKVLHGLSIDTNNYTESETNIVYNYHVGKVIECLQKTKHTSVEEEEPDIILNPINSKEYIGS